MLLQGTVGPTFEQDGAVPTGGIRQGRLGDVLASELHGRFYEQVFRGNTYSIGVTSLAALTANTITLTNTTTPILGVWNPSTSTVNLVMLQATLTAVINTVTSPVGYGVFVWASSLGNVAITTGNAPFNRKNLGSVGSQAKGFNMSPALTGLTNNLVIFEGADIASGSALTHGTIANTNVIPSVEGVQNFDGGLIVPPGGVLALLNTTSTTTFSVCGRLTWEEVPTT